jgi:ABC-2 type transport system ATP-binding protein
MSMETKAPAPLACEGLTLRYGRRTVLQDVTFTVPAGCVYALLGRNGAGKSSLARCLTGQIPRAGGDARVLGLDPWTARVRVMERVGLVPEDPDAPPEMTASSLLSFVSSLQPRLDVESVRTRLVRLDVPLDRPFAQLSKGQKGSVMLALALGHHPALLILDDPTLGLDVPARNALFEELIGDLADHGTAVLVTTHDLRAIEGVADRIGILKDGRLVVDEPLEDLKGRFGQPLEEIFTSVVAGSREVRA